MPSCSAPAAAADAAVPAADRAAPGTAPTDGPCSDRAADQRPRPPPLPPPSPRPPPPPSGDAAEAAETQPDAEAEDPAVVADTDVHDAVGGQVGEEDPQSSEVTTSLAAPAARATDPDMAQGQ